MQSFHLRDAEFAAEKVHLSQKATLERKQVPRKSINWLGCQDWNSFLKGQRFSNFDLNIKHNSKALMRKSTKAIEE